MGNPVLDEINLLTLPEINDACIEDNFFLAGVLQAHLRAKCFVPYEGGAFTRNNFLFNPLNGGAYPKGGGGFSMVKPNTLSATVFDPRYYCVMIVEYLEDLDVLNTGDLSIFSLLETDVANAYQTISAIMALDIQQNGQVAPRTFAINGWVEALNDGLLPSYDGNIYTSYGLQSRGGAIRNALNGNVYWGGQQDGTAGVISYPQLNAMYKLCQRGKDEPDLIVGNKPIISFVENRLQAQQRFGQEFGSVKDPYFGVTGFRFKNAVVMQDDYFPSALGYPYSDASNDGLGNNKTAAFANPVVTAANNFPITGNAANLTPGEVLCMYNTSRIKFRVRNSKEFGFNPTDFIRDAQTTKIASQLKAAVNLEFTACWPHCQGFGWNG